jgi:hypothetical protein
MTLYNWNKLAIKPPMRRILFIGSFLMLAGCQTPLEQLHSLAPQANDFESALAA